MVGNAFGLCSVLRVEVWLFPVKSTWWLEHGGVLVQFEQKASSCNPHMVLQEGNGSCFLEKQIQFRNKCFTINSDTEQNNGSRTLSVCLSKNIKRLSAVIERT